MIITSLKYFGNCTGGTWVAIAGKFLIGVGTHTDTNGDKRTLSAGQIGGEYGHVLSIDEMPNHNHSIHVAGTRLDVNGDNNFRVQVYTPTSGGDFWNLGLARSPQGSHDAAITATGNSKKHNNIPPYLAVYMWQRTS